ncbi:hypothetical protein [Pseudomonas sichuanensis]|uniref:hypothetical protein n=1 Tax=Pseudomonas sichuanensis TaxID=2213015 RepID=UPI002AB80938|nr:hypothetical protein [Pseudomonas sichuanensis]MDZ4020994.1 hypothetical protein [Pseudomonas sichuanensis]
MTEVKKLASRIIEIDGHPVKVPVGIARHKTRNSWELRVQRAGRVIAAGTYPDGKYGGYKASLSAAISYMIQEGAERLEGGLSLRLSKIVTAVWVFRRGALRAVACVYNPQLKKNKIVFLASLKTVVGPNGSAAMRKRLEISMHCAYEIEHQCNGVPKDEAVKIAHQVELILIGDEYRAFVKSSQNARSRTPFKSGSLRPGNSSHAS